MAAITPSASPSPTPNTGALERAGAPSDGAVVAVASERVGAAGTGVGEATAVGLGACVAVGGTGVGVCAALGSGDGAAVGVGMRLPTLAMGTSSTSSIGSPPMSHRGAPHAAGGSEMV